MKSANTVPRATVYHDGNCPLCRIEVKTMKKIDSERSIEWVDINDNQEALESAGITFEQAMARMHVKEQNQTMQTGMSAFLVIWQELPYYRRMVPIIRHTPRLLPLLEAIYCLFAKFRLYLAVRRARKTDQKKN